MNDTSMARRRRGAPARYAAALGVALLAAAGLALWASEGAKIFIDSAFSALIACF